MNHQAIEDHYKQEGYVEAPGWMPICLDGYDWAYPHMAILMRPAPRIRHRLRYQLAEALTPRWLKRRQAKRLLND